MNPQIIMLLFAGLSQSQSAKVDWLQQNAVPVQTLDPRVRDLSDLTPLKDAIGNARIVQLGEQSHRDGATFLAKVRLIRFLHEQLGFNVLAWESGFFDCEEMDSALRGNEPLGKAIQRGVFEMWGRSALVRPLFEYTRLSHKTRAPLRMTGVDIQFSGSRQTYANRLFGFIDRWHRALPAKRTVSLSSTWRRPRGRGREAISLRRNSGASIGP